MSRCRGRQAEAVIPEGHQLPGSGSIVQDGTARSPDSLLRGRSGKGKPALGWPLPESLSARPAWLCPAEGTLRWSHAWPFPAGETRPCAPARLSLPPFPSDLIISYLKKKKKLISLPVRSEAISRLLYIKMFSYSSRLPLPSTDSL